MDKRKHELTRKGEYESKYDSPHDEGECSLYPSWVFYRESCRSTWSLLVRILLMAQFFICFGKLLKVEWGQPFKYWRMRTLFGCKTGHKLWISSTFKTALHYWNLSWKCISNFKNLLIFFYEMCLKAHGHLWHYFRQGYLWPGYSDLTYDAKVCLMDKWEWPLTC